MTAQQDRGSRSLRRSRSRWSCRRYRLPNPVNGYRQGELGEASFLLDAGRHVAQDYDGPSGNPATGSGRADVEARVTSLAPRSTVELASVRPRGPGAPWGEGVLTPGDRRTVEIEQREGRTQVVPDDVVAVGHAHDLKGRRIGVDHGARRNP